MVSSQKEQAPLESHATISLMEQNGGKVTGIGNQWITVFGIMVQPVTISAMQFEPTDGTKLAKLYKCDFKQLEKPTFPPGKEWRRRLQYKTCRLLPLVSMNKKKKNFSPIWLKLCPVKPFAFLGGVCLHQIEYIGIQGQMGSN